MARGRLLVFVDALFWRQGQEYSNNRAFTLFPCSFAPPFDTVTFLGRVHPEPGRGPYPMPADGRTAVEPLPFYPDLYATARLAAVLPRLLCATWRAVKRADVLWLCIPHPVALVAWAFARLQRKTVFFMVRQEIVGQVAYKARRLRRLAGMAVRILEAVFIRLARRTLTFTVGGRTRKIYGAGGGPVEEILVSLVPARSLEGARARRLPTPSATPTLLWVGRMEPEKGLETLPEALQWLDQRGHKGVSVELAGVGSVESRLRAQILDAGLEERFRFLGYVPFGPELENLYRRATLLVLPSYEEGFPQVLLEAMAAGVPVVATSVGGIPLRLTSGAEALLVPAGDPVALAQAIAQVLDSPALYAALSEKGLEFVRRHTLESQRQRMLERLDAWSREGK